MAERLKEIETLMFWLETFGPDGGRPGRAGVPLESRSSHILLFMLFFNAVFDAGYRSSNRACSGREPGRSTRASPLRMHFRPSLGQSSDAVGSGYGPNNVEDNLSH